MARLAASGYDTQISEDGESYIEKYIKGVAAVESVITLDRLGQVCAATCQCCLPVLPVSAACQCYLSVLPVSAMSRFIFMCYI